ncbi:hypothetical protein D477_017869 [Arthrobacter crystallopoietes BAB-32]|uniref:DUF3040 domain-containing protein n=1 Tax=Arthrobacter crystallopoietes BAB-32 TaxID=1246476 RepID=N1V3R7_9MICC|nr:DUF3040 domain-containing protein [Arthrobacter crystallopoietes]EMY32878.1 hypothetical protein D477_017869 [Arthrobacter crystallopoietes BAB-32]
MSLSDEEQQRLAKLGRQLEEEDPRLAKSLSGNGVRVFGFTIGAGALVALAGLLLLFVGMAGNSLLLAMLGVIALCAGVLVSGSDWYRRHVRH